MEFRLKYYEYWRMNYGTAYVLVNFIRITKLYNSLKEMCTVFELEEDFNTFFKGPAERRNFAFTEKYLGELSNRWENRAGISYSTYLKKIFGT